MPKDALPSYKKKPICLIASIIVSLLGLPFIEWILANSNHKGFKINVVEFTVIHYI